MALKSTSAISLLNPGEIDPDMQMQMQMQMVMTISIKELRSHSSNQDLGRLASSSLLVVDPPNFRQGFEH